VIGHARHTCAGHYGIVAPIVVCDGCGRPVRGPGVVHSVTLPDGSMAPVVSHSHPGTCTAALTDAITAAFPGGTVAATDLATWLAHLAANASTDEARR